MTTRPLHPGEVGALDADPICDYCQDRCGFKAYAARLSPAGRGRVLARVRYVDCGTRSSLRLRLAAIAGGWRVADVEARSVPSLVAYLARANRQAAREESAQAFMRRIYEPILAGSDAMSPEDPPPPDTYDARLGALFERSSELADRKGIIPPIDGEPLCDCQDWSPLQNFSIRLQRCGGRTCEAEIGFVSDDRPTRLSFDLVRTDEGGRVADLGSAEDPSLRADLRKWIKQEQKN